MNTTKKAPTSERRLTTAVPPPKYARPRMPMALPIGIATVSATMARTRRSSLTASRRSRLATSAALRRSRLGQLMVARLVAHDREVDVLQGRQLAHLLARGQSRRAAQLGQVADREGAPGRHDPDLLTEGFRLLHAVSADHQRAALGLEVLQVSPRAPGAVGVERGGRLVGEHQARPVERGADERDLLPHALGEGAEPAVAGVDELE